MSIGADGTSAVMSGCGLFVVIPLLGVPMLFLGFLLGNVTAGVVLGGLLIIPLLAVYGHAFLVSVRTAAWMRGPTLVVRGAYSTHEADLSTAQVWIDSVPETAMVMSGGQSRARRTGRQIPRLNARDIRTGDSVRLPLRQSTGALLPPHQLHSLATAILSGPRSPQDAQHAKWLADGLHSLTTNPFIGNL
ncbi:hypothetical protein [Nocardia huaxiensis]|uniref:hypothetical protein n=1 Tax=Nocardia huaxiensis TaxID=2755382 RepID=UPI001E35D05A|nr:hypothetical protein [Nocardia huaxiensis]UFS97042.1 hypothetical protein LPY97_03660 [Nocardia huaxiensis]